MAGYKAFSIAILISLLFPDPCTGAAGLWMPSYYKSGDVKIYVVFIPIIILAILFTFFCCLSRFLNSRHYRTNIDQSIFGVPRFEFGDLMGDAISLEELGKFQASLYWEVKELMAGKGQLVCTICLGEFEDHEWLRLLPGCGHAFHRDCIDTWLLSSHATCPICRARPAAAPAVVASEDEVIITIDQGAVMEQEEEEEERRMKEVRDLLQLQSCQMGMSRSCSSLQQQQRPELGQKYSTGHSVGHPGEGIVEFMISSERRSTDLFMIETLSSDNASI